MKGLFKSTVTVVVLASMLLITTATVFAEGPGSDSTLSDTIHSGSSYVEAYHIGHRAARASVQFKVCPAVAATIGDPEHTSIVYLVNGGGPGSGRVAIGEALKVPGVSFVKVDGIPIGPAGVSMIEVAIGEDFPGERFMLLPGKVDIVLCPEEREIVLRPEERVEPGSYVQAYEPAHEAARASVQFKVCPAVAATIGDPEHTSIVYLVNGGGPGSDRVAIGEALKVPGVSFARVDGIPIGPAGISMIEVAIGEDFPGERFMLLPGKVDIVLCPE